MLSIVSSLANLNYNNKIKDKKHMQNSKTSTKTCIRLNKNQQPTTKKKQLKSVDILPIILFGVVFSSSYLLCVFCLLFCLGDGVTMPGEGSWVSKVIKDADAGSYLPRKSEKFGVRKRME